MSQSELSEKLSGIFWLGSSGLISALSLLVLSARQLPGLHGDEVPKLLLLMQWHALGWSCSKMGIDYAVFGIVTRHSDRTFDLRHVIQGWSGLIVFAFGVLSGVLYGPLTGVLLSIALFADTLSAIRNAELNARRLFKVGAIGNLLYYPLFVASWAILAHWISPTIDFGLALLAACSWLRLIWFITYSPRSTDSKQSRIESRALPAAQGVLNLVLFRSDQVALSLLIFVTMTNMPSTEFMGQYVYLGRLIDISTGVLVMIGTVLFPLYFLQDSITSRHNQRRQVAFASAGLIASTLFGALLVGIGMHLYAGTTPAWGIALPFLIQVPLTFICNYLTFSMQRDERFIGLLKNQMLAISSGVALIGFTIIENWYEWLPWVIPCQLTLFTLLCLFSPWGPKTKVYGDIQK